MQTLLKNPESITTTSMFKSRYPPSLCLQLCHKPNKKINPLALLPPKVLINQVRRRYTQKTGKVASSRTTQLKNQINRLLVPPKQIRFCSTHRVS